MILPLLMVAAGCAVPPGWQAIEARQARYIVLGETHGTTESPRMVGDIVCALAARRQRLLVAVEQDARDDAALQRIWAQPTPAFAAALPTVLRWQGREDGNASVAIRDLLVRLHGLKSRGRPIAIVAFNGARYAGQARRFADLPGQGSHEAMQAENIRHAADGGRYDRVLVLVGNLHAAKAPVHGGGVTFDPMAMRLASASAVLSLNMIGGAGTAWTRIARPGVKMEPGRPITDDMIECAAHASPGIAGMDGTPRAALGTPPVGYASPFVHDGYIWIGPVTASPPVAPVERSAG